MLTAGHCTAATGNPVFRSDAGGRTDGPQTPTRALYVACTNFQRDSSSGAYVCTPFTGTVIGNEGDSGRPWIVHSSGSNVNIADTDVGGGYCDSMNNHCTEEVYEEIGPIESKYSLTIP